MDPDALTRTELAALKAATRRVIAAQGGQISAALDFNLAQCTVSEYVNPKKLDRFIPIDRVALAERFTGKPFITAELARLSGHVLIELPQLDGDDVWSRELGAIAKEAGEAMHALGEAIAQGGTVTAEEIRNLKIVDELQDAIAALVHAKSMCEAVLKEEGGK